MTAGEDVIPVDIVGPLAGATPIVGSQSTHGWQGHDGDNKNLEICGNTARLPRKACGAAVEAGGRAEAAEKSHGSLETSCKSATSDFLCWFLFRWPGCADDVMLALCGVRLTNVDEC